MRRRLGHLARLTATRPNPPEPSPGQGRLTTQPSEADVQGPGGMSTLLKGCLNEHTGRAGVHDASAVVGSLCISASQTYSLVRSGDLQAIQIGGRNQWRVERVKLEETVVQAYRRTVANLDQLPAEPPQV